ncbi:hypothetical protein IU459_32925 [Nocardia amamiensis]|uniref:Uncharacterized protein n=1 Tax=Nocardia amamiensis TaxID=404578 RepID=A0ABS0D0K6_9NOCA|nr:hypothetical protein [Nocardia amamiensis]MBF6302310.1 hypothetical protein [Nocardia amamiensis]
MGPNSGAILDAAKVIGDSSVREGRTVSTAVKVKNGAEPTDQEAQRWLAATELASDQRAAILLTRAMFPARFGFAQREPLIPPAADSDCAAKVMWLLKVGQTPTPVAVLKAASTKSAKKLARRNEWFARQQRAKKVISTTKDVTALSKLLAEAVAAHWCEHGTGPHWSEAVAAPEVAQWWTEATGMAYLGKDFRQAIFLTAQKLGWIAFNTQERSLCTGRRFHRRHLAAEISKAPHEDIGYFTAAYISIHQAIHGHSPNWAQIAEAATDQNGLLLFLDADDATAQSRWIATHGWIVLRDGSIQPGKRVAAEARSRGHSMPVVDKIETPPAPGAPAPEITITAAVGSGTPAPSATTAPAAPTSGR